jgi:hypothetical protein
LKAGSGSEFARHGIIYTSTKREAGKSADEYRYPDWMPLIRDFKEFASMAMNFRERNDPVYFPCRQERICNVSFLYYPGNLLTSKFGGKTNL